ncbi:hypothetical protein Q1695_012630 [Nippostrongylus brasiliensis]|nr:hypothetical protein Q1695_012630 [Nippostrongylus brasiliensis]
MIRSSYAWFSLLKAMCGVGVFALPVAYKQSGLCVGTALTVLLGIANAHCMLKLVKCSQYLCKLIEDKDNEKSSPDSKKGQPDAETSKSEKSSKSKREQSRKDPKKGKEDRKLLTTVTVECEKEQLKAGSTMKSVEGLANDSNASKASAKHEGGRNGDRCSEENEKKVENDKAHSISTLSKNDVELGTTGVTLDYGAMASEAFAIKDSWLRHLAGSFKMAVNLCLVLLQLGICSVFYIFVADHVKEVLDNLYSTNLSINVIFFALLPFFLALVSVQNLNVMSLIAFIGNLMILAALFIIDTGMVFREHIPFSQLSMVTTVGSAASAAGSITYALH